MAINTKTQRHKSRLYVPLWVRILLLAALNLTILAIVSVIFLRLQLRPELESFLMAEARERIGSVTQLVVADLQSTDISHWTEVLGRYSREYGVTFLLYRNTGEQLAGPATQLPPEVDVRLPRGGPPPPPRGEFGPPPGPGPGFFAPPGPPFLAVSKSEPQYWIGVRMPFIEGPNHESLRSVLMLVSPTFFTNPFFFEMRPWIMTGAVVIVISVLCWLPLVRNLTHSIADMQGATAHIAEGHFEVELKVRRNDELGSLGTAISRMAARLKTLTEGRKRFLGDAAHELRSPIARMLLAAEILERDAQPSARKYIGDLKDDLNMMSQLTDELLQFARAESALKSPELVPINVLEAVQTAARRETADGADIRIDVDPAIVVRGNMEYLVRSLGNVLRNAVRYAGDQGPIQVSAHRKNPQVQIIVADSGPGIPEDALDKIFTPFYRLDDARDRRTGGTGLGLAIVRTCIEACGGTVECRNRRPSGLEVMMRLPAA